MSEKDKKNEPYLDPKIVEEVESLPAEEPFLTDYGAMGQGNAEDKIKFIEKWFPGEKEWKGKTIITYRQARALSLLLNLTDVFEEVEELEPFIDGLVKDYEMYLTSVDGIAREQQASILRRVLGGPSEEQEAATSAMLSMFANPEEENDD